MHADEFERRLARVRHRFATTLESKISDAINAADLMRGHGGHVTQRVQESYRQLHGICGIGPTVGFAATAEAARAAEVALLQAYREGRGMTEAEVLLLKSSLARVHDAASSELQSMYQRGG